MLFKKNKIILFVLVTVIFIYVSYKNDTEIFNKKVSHQKTNFALTSTSNPSKICKEYKETYPYLDKLKLEIPIQLRFENTHLKINNKIYRLRHFFKDGDEGEIETFLVYLEDQNEDAHIIEKSSYHKWVNFIVTF